MEALFQDRFQTIALALGKLDLDEELGSSKAFWDLAKEVVAEQFPDVADKVEWPETEAYVSMFKRIKYLYKITSMKTSVKGTLSHYSRVSRHRNALFHGATEERLPVEVVEQAIGSFDWLEQNFALAERGPQTNSPK